jgi:hypothetical protein
MLNLPLELEDEVVGAIEGDRENSKENNRNDALGLFELETLTLNSITENSYPPISLTLLLTLTLPLTLTLSLCLSVSLSLQLLNC